MSFQGDTWYCLLDLLELSDYIKVYNFVFGHIILKLCRDGNYIMGSAGDEMLMNFVW